MQGSYFIQCHPAGEFGLKYLIEGKNVFAAQVLYNDPYIAEKQTDERAAIYGVISPAAYVDLPGPLSVAGVRGHLMFLYAFLDAEKLMNALGRTGLASEYRTRREKLCARIMECCYDAEKGLFREGPAFRQYTRHAQAWAVLCGLFEGEEAAALLDLHCSCCPETPKGARSDCHAWSALPLYVLPKTDISEPAPEMEKK